MRKFALWLKHLLSILALIVYIRSEKNIVVVGKSVDDDPRLMFKCHCSEIDIFSSNFGAKHDGGTLRVDLYCTRLVGTKFSGRRS